MSEHRKGLLLTTLGVCLLIPDATFVRLIDASSLTNALWRSGLLAVSLTLFLILKYRFRLFTVVKQLGRWGVTSSLFSGLGTILFVGAIDRTSVANVLLILALSPIWAAVLTRFVTRVPVRTHTLVAVPFAFLGVSIALSGSVENLNNAGNLLALFCSLVLASNLTLIRAHKRIDMVPAVALGGVLGFVALSLAGTSPRLLPGDLTPTLILGALILPSAMALMTMGGRYLPSPETALLLLGETALSPVLAAIVIKESIPLQSLVGGSIVILTLFLHACIPLSSRWSSHLDKTLRTTQVLPVDLNDSDS
ncbi:MAG: drug/metabolite transporter (DMT)-like permease [Candidatus Poriferisodalaceae bacterium]|jgi:drug/metabolite transporter (DMT)-like permease